MPYLVAMRLPSPSLPAQASAGRRTYPSAPQSASRQYDCGYPTRSLERCPSIRDIVLPYPSSLEKQSQQPSMTLAPFIAAGGPLITCSEASARLQHLPAIPSPYVFVGASCLSTAASDRGCAARSRGGDAVRDSYGHLLGTFVQT